MGISRANRLIVCFLVALSGGAGVFYFAGCHCPPAAECTLPRDKNVEFESLSARRERHSQIGAVQAGMADDNQQFNYYLNYLDRFSEISAWHFNPTDRIVFTVMDKNGLPISNCDLQVISEDGKILARRKTYADGKAMFFPREYSLGYNSHGIVKGNWNGRTLEKPVDFRTGPRSVMLQFSEPREPIKTVPLDIAFVIDTTGSMGDEIEKLKATLAAIHFRITQLTPKPDARFAMVLYRDKGDSYRTKVVPFTADFDQFAKSLDAVQASGGGDTPEDIQQALEQTVKDLKWRPDGVRMAFVLGDAPPHLDYDQEFTYLDAVRQAAGKGIKITTIGASGLDAQGEYIFRQIAQYTRGLFVFLTYGETGDSDGDSLSGVSHHTGSNWAARNLDAIIVQSIAKELSYLGDKPVQLGEEYFLAHPTEGLKNDIVMDELFEKCVTQLVDFSQVRLTPNTKTAIISARREDGCPVQMASSLTDRLTIAMSREKTFKMLERENLAELEDEIDLAISNAGTDGLADLSKLQDRLPADLLVTSKVRRSAAGYEMFVKILRVKSGEVISASMLKIDPQLIVK